MGDLGLDAFRCEDYFGNLATHGDTSSRPTAKDACLDECNERLAAARARDCGLTADECVILARNSLEACFVDGGPRRAMWSG